MVQGLLRLFQGSVEVKTVFIALQSDEHIVEFFGGYLIDSMTLIVNGMFACISVF